MKVLRVEEQSKFLKKVDVSMYNEDTDLSIVYTINTGKLNLILSSAIPYISNIIVIATGISSDKIKNLHDGNAPIESYVYEFYLYDYIIEDDELHNTKKLFDIGFKIDRNINYIYAVLTVNGKDVYDEKVAEIQNEFKFVTYGEINDNIHFAITSQIDKAEQKIQKLKSDFNSGIVKLYNLNRERSELFTSLSKMNGYSIVEDIDTGDIFIDD